MPPMSPVLARSCSRFAACGGASDVDHPADRPHQANADVDWRDQVIYQIMIDRFSNGDPNNDFNVEPSVPGKFHGGDWQGVIDQPRLPQDARRDRAVDLAGREERRGGRRLRQLSRLLDAGLLAPERALRRPREAARADRQGARAEHARDPRRGDEPHGAALLLRHQRQRSARRHALRRRLLAHVPADLHAEPGAVLAPTS